MRGDQLEPDLRGAAVLAGLGEGGAGLEQRLGQVGVEGAGALGLGEGGGGVALVAERGGEERVGERVVGLARRARPRARPGRRASRPRRRRRGRRGPGGRRRGR